MIIKYSKQSLKFLTRLNLTKRIAVIGKIKTLPAGDVKKFVNNPNASYQLRVGTIRILFKISKNEITITKVGNRGDIYK